MLISLHILIFYLQEIAFELPIEWFVVNATFPLLQGVFLYLYTGILLQKIQVTSILALHFLPFLIFAILGPKFGEILLNPLIICVVISGIVYITLTFGMLGRFDSFYKRNNHWLKILTSGLAIVWAVFILSGMLNHLFDYSLVKHEYIFLSVNIFVFAIGFFGLKQGLILQEPQLKSKYSSSPLGIEDFKKIKNRLDILATSTQFYLNSELKISDLASQLNIPTHHLSQYFSAFLDTSYYDYINGLRIDEFKQRIVKNELDTLSLLGLALECGFNSKATFNRAFKKVHGQTPTEYLNSSK